MTDQDYEQKKRECWEEFCRHIIDEQEEFYNMFDLAYALGKQIETISQEEIEKAANEFADREYEIGQVDWDALHKGYYHGMKNALDKQEKDAYTVIQGWVGRDQDGNLPLFVGSKPYKQEGMDYWSVPHGRSLEYLNLNPALFPDLTWESDPIEVEIQIKRKKK